jgi:hypothetical protein
MTLMIVAFAILYFGSHVHCFPDEGIELKTNEVYGLTTPSERVHVYGQNPGSETLRTQYNYITTNDY